MNGHRVIRTQSQTQEDTRCLENTGSGTVAGGRSEKHNRWKGSWSSNLQIIHRLIVKTSLLVTTRINNIGSTFRLANWITNISDWPRPLVVVILPALTYHRLLVLHGTLYNLILQYPMTLSFLTRLVLLFLAIHSSTLTAAPYHPLPTFSNTRNRVVSSCFVIICVPGLLISDNVSDGVSLCAVSLCSGRTQPHTQRDREAMKKVSINAQRRRKWG